LRGKFDKLHSRPHEVLATVAVGKREAAMKKVVTTPSVEVALRTLDNDNRRRVHAWFDQLRNWDGDEFVRSHSHRLDSIPDVYVLKTSTDFRVFFTIHGNTVTIIDIANKQAILGSGRSPEAE
jgi:mRNA-degrading endonuclease RelE of RelBE toxin-antitoxin system